MSGQRSLDFDARARRTDVATSKVAAASVAAFGADHRRLILTALESGGSGTIYELGQRTRLDHVAVARRMSELHELGLVERTTETRAGPTGRQCAVWRIR